MGRVLDFLAKHCELSLSMFNELVFIALEDAIPIQKHPVALQFLEDGSTVPGIQKGSRSIA